MAHGSDPASMGERGIEPASNPTPPKRLDSKRGKTMNPFPVIFRAPFVMLAATWQILVMLAGRVLRNAYRRWF